MRLGAPLSGLPGGLRIAYCRGIMYRPPPKDSTRGKTVWGPKRTALTLAMLLGLSPSAMAAGKGKHESASRHIQKAPKAKPGEPSRRVKHYKMDDEVSGRQNRNPLFTSRVIVTLQPGAKLPAAFRMYARGKDLGL